MKLTTKLFIAAMIILVIGLLTGCKDRYRYPCQNVENWDKPECQKPICEVHKLCPSHIFGRDPNFNEFIKN